MSASLTARQKFEKSLQRYVKDRPDVIKEIEYFRNELLSNFNDSLINAESGIQNTIVGTEYEPELYPVASPHKHMSKEKKDEMLLAISSAFLEQHQRGNRNFANKPIYKVLEELEHEHGFEDLTAKACKKIYKKMEKGRNILNPEERRYWAASYEANENMILLNELPKQILPQKDDTSEILKPLWKGINTSKDYNLGRNHDWSEDSLYLTIIHEMTHAFLSVQLKHKEGRDPMMEGNETIQALDEAVAGMTKYLFTDQFPKSDYSDKGIPQKQLENFRRLYKQYCDEMMEKYNSEKLGGKKKIVSKMRAHALFTARSIMSGKDPEKAFQEEIRY